MDDGDAFPSTPPTRRISALSNLLQGIHRSSHVSETVEDRPLPQQDTPDLLTVADLFGTSVAAALTAGTPQIGSPFRYLTRRDAELEPPPVS